MITSLGLDQLEPTTLLSKKQICEQGIPLSTLNDWMKDPVDPLPTVKIRRRVFVTTSDWNDYIERNRR